MLFERDVFGDWAAYSERDTEVFRLEIIYIIILDSKYDYRTEGNVSYFEFGGRVSDAALLAGNMSCRRRESFATTYVRLRWENERRFG